MKPIFYRMNCFLGILLCTLSFAAACQDRTSLELWYDRPATTWEGTLPLGNGRLGMMPAGGVSAEDIVLNDITLWSGSPQDANNPGAYRALPGIRRLISEGKNEQAQALVNRTFICEGPGSGGARYGCYQVLGNLHLRFSYPGAGASGPRYRDYRRSLSLDSAIATCSYRVNGVRYRREYFTSFSDDVDVIRITADRPGMIDCSISLDRPERFHTDTRGDTLEMAGVLDNGTDGHGMKYLAKVKTRLVGGSVHAVGDSLEIKNATAVVIFVSAATDFRDPSYKAKIDRLLAAAEKKSYGQGKTAHIKAYRKLYSRVDFRLGGADDTGLATDRRLSRFAGDSARDNGLATLFFQYGRYLEISSTRPGLLPPNLQGLWANQIHTPWTGDYHLDVNAEMDNWPDAVCNLLELDEPLTALTESLVKPGARTARAYFRAGGWVAHVITNVWGYTAPGEAASWGITLCGSGWLCDNLWQHYAFSQDRDYLKRIYPVLKGAARFYSDILIRDSVTGWWVAAPSSSPENAFFLPDGKSASVCMGATIDNQIMRQLFSNVVKASRLLETDEGFRDTLEKKLGQLPPPGQVSRDGSLMEWLRDYPQTDVHHRHISHLYGLYPAALITPDGTPRLADAAKKTLVARGDDGPSWSIAYKMLWWARLREGDSAYRLYRELMRPTGGTFINYGAGGGVYPNLLSAGPPFQIDGNFGGTAAIAEMLVQSHEGLIRFLPALPDAWPDGVFSGLRVRGGGIAGATWKDHRLQTASIEATCDFTFTVKIPAAGKYRITLDGKPFRASLHSGHVTLPMKKGQKAVFTLDS